MSSQFGNVTMFTWASITIAIWIDNKWYAKWWNNMHQYIWHIAIQRATFVGGDVYHTSNEGDAATLIPAGSQYIRFILIWWRYTTVIGGTNYYTKTYGQLNLISLTKPQLAYKYLS